MRTNTLKFNFPRMFAYAPRHMNSRRAAQELNVASSAVSGHIKEFEEGIGTTFFWDEKYCLQRKVAAALLIGNVRRVRCLAESRGRLARIGACTLLTVSGPS